MFFVYVINLLCNLLVTLIMIEAIMSWFTPSFGPTLGKIYMLLRTVTDPLVAPFRVLCQRLAYSTGIDFSPFIAILVIQAVARLLVRLII